MSSASVGVRASVSGPIDITAGYAGFIWNPSSVTNCTVSYTGPWDGAVTGGWRATNSGQVYSWTLRTIGQLPGKLSQITVEWGAYLASTAVNNPRFDSSVFLTTVNGGVQTNYLPTLVTIFPNVIGYKYLYRASATIVVPTPLPTDYISIRLVNTTSTLTSTNIYRILAVF